jgi:dihydrofolate reductase
MRKLLVFNLITLDGYFEGPDHDISWHMVDDEFNEMSISQLHTVDTIIFGRTTYEMMASYWPTNEAIHDDPIVAGLMNSTPKVVFSNTLKKADWKNTRLVNGDAAAEIIKMKQLPGKDLIIFGSGKLTVSLTNAGLIDQYGIIICPVILGQGKALFQGVNPDTKLKLISSRKFNNGNVLLTYKPNWEEPKA